MKEDLKKIGLGILVVVAVIVGIAIISFVLLAGMMFLLEPNLCDARTADMNIESRWSFWGGCQIEVEEGQWIPLKNYRYAELEPQLAD